MGIKIATKIYTIFTVTFLHDKYITMENLYEHPRIKPLLDDNKNPSFEATGYKYGSQTMIVGGTGTGKTHYLLHFILKSPNTFQHIVICNRAIKEPLYDALENRLGKKGALTFFTLKTLPDVNELSKMRENQEKDQWLIVFDDVVNDLTDRKMEAKLNNYVTTGRKLGFTTFFLSQSFYAFPKMVRRNITNLALLKLSGVRDLNSILSEFAQIGLTKEQLRDIHRKATEQWMNCLRIDIHNPDNNEKFKRNFTDAFIVTEHTNEKTKETVVDVTPGPWYKPMKANDHLLLKRGVSECASSDDEYSSSDDDDPRNAKKSKKSKK